MTMYSLYEIGMASIMLVWATVEDIRTFTIPLLCILFGTLAGTFGSILAQGVHGAIESGIGGLLGLGLGWILVKVTKLGEGDAYLYMALGVIFGPMMVMCIFVLSNAIVLIRTALPVIRKQKTRLAVAPYITVATVLSVSLYSFHLFNL